MRDIFSELLHLFKGVIVKDITSFDTFDVTFTFPELKTDYFNFILPTVSFEKFNWDLAEKTIEEYKSRNVPIHYYLRSNTQQAFIDYLATQGKKVETEALVYVENPTVTISDDKNLSLEEYTDDTFAEAVQIANTCFPDYTNNAEYMEGIYKARSENKQWNLFLVSEGRKIGIGQVIYSDVRKSAYFHNFAILPDYRRMGYFTLFKQLVIKRLQQKGIELFLSINAINGGSHLANEKLGWKEFDRLNLVGDVENP
jgi:GNAT superfamily N-acetyltransferase